MIRVKEVHLMTYQVRIANIYVRAAFIIYEIRGASVTHQYACV